MKPDIRSLVERLRSLAHVHDRHAVRLELEDHRPEDISDALIRLPHDEGMAILAKLDPEQAAEILSELPTETTRKYLAELPDSTLAHYLEILPSDDALDLRDQIGEERFDGLLEVVSIEKASKVRRLLAYPEDSVGRIMTEAFFEVAPDMTMGDVLTDIRRSPEDKYESVNDIYVVGEDRHLLGVISLRKAIRAKPQVSAREVMNDEVVSCSTDEPAEDASRRMAKYGFYALPVVDSKNRMVGLLTGDDAQEIIREADTEDMLRFGGVTGDADSYLALSPWQLAKRRVVWLFALFIAETFTGSVMRHYAGGEESSDLKIAPVTFFIPLLIGAGGNSGSQTTTTITRALAVGEIKPSDALVVLGREFVTSMFVGLLLGLAAFANAYWRWGQGMSLSVAVGLALPAIIVWSTSVGSLLPLGAKRIGIDPAVMSAPFIATLVDATGLIIYFEIARHIV